MPAADFEREMLDAWANGKGDVTRRFAGQHGLIQTQMDTRRRQLEMSQGNMSQSNIPALVKIARRVAKQIALGDVIPETTAFYNNIIDELEATVPNQGVKQFLGTLKSVRALEAA